MKFSKCAPFSTVKKYSIGRKRKLIQEFEKWGKLKVMGKWLSQTRSELFLPSFCPRELIDGQMAEQNPVGLIFVPESLVEFPLTSLLLLYFFPLFWK
jgi:hypothetical protein